MYFLLILDFFFEISLYFLLSKELSDKREVGLILFLITISLIATFFLVYLSKILSSFFEEIIKLGIISKLFSETTFPILLRIEISIGSKDMSLELGLRIFFGTSIKITGRSNVNAYSKEIPDQSEIIHTDE